MQTESNEVIHQIERRQLAPPLSLPATRAKNLLDLVLWEELTQ